MRSYARPWVESSLFCFKARNQFPDPQLVVDRRGDPSVVLDLVVEFFALVTHFQSAFAQVGWSHDHKEEAAPISSPGELAYF